MTANLTPLFEAYFATNLGPDGAMPDYGIQAVSDSPQFDDIQLEVTFKSGERYCCGEPGCHFAPDWSRLRSLAAELGIRVGCPITVRLHGVVAAGSSFVSAVQLGGPAENEPYEFDRVYSEGEAGLPGAVGED